MTNDTHQTPDDPNGFDLGSHDSPQQQADARVVHGLLLMLDRSEAARIAARVDRATSAIRAAELAPQPARTRNHTFRERLAWIGGSLGMAAAIGLALLFFPSSTEATALAALDSIRSATRTGGRCYEVLVQPQRPPHGAEDQRRPQGASRGPLDRPDRGNLDGFRRVGELRLGAEGRWTLTMLKPRRDLGNPPAKGDRPPLVKVVMGFDGREYWAVEPDGSIRRFDSVRALGGRSLGLVTTGILNAPDAEAEEDGASGATTPETIEFMSLSSLLESLERDYTVTFDSRAQTESAFDRPITVVQARRTRAVDGRTPMSVRLVADASTLQVLSVRLTWADERPKGVAGAERPAVSPAAPKSVLIRHAAGTGCGDTDADWFRPERHQ